MAIIGTLPSIIQNGQLVDAAPVMADFNYIVNQVNANALPVGFTPAGVLLSVGIFQGNATYTPNPLATKAIVEAVGGGGGGAGTGATAAGQVSTGGGGAAGSYGRIIILSGLTTQTVTIGIGGAGGLATQVGGNGTATSFGALMVCPGGAGGQATTPATPPFISNPSSPGTLPSGTGSFLVAGLGGPGTPGIAMQAVNANGGGGGASFFGGGAAARSSTAGGLAATSPGAGGGGGLSTQSQGSVTGGEGANGLLLVYEFA